MKTRRLGERGLTDRENWPSYLGGILTETGFILGLTALAFIMAVIAKAVL
jgi:hypothetical protein